MRVKIESFLREVCEKTTKNNEYPVLTSSKSGLFLQSDYFNKQVASTDNTGYKIIKKGQFTYRAMSDTGEFYPNMLECVDVGIVSPAYPVFEIFQTDLIIPEYLKYYFKSNAFQHAISSFAQGSTRTSVKFNKLKTASIDLPSKQEQTNILRLLKKAETLIASRQQELQKLDDLVKARFVEMFENISYPTERFSRFIESLTSGSRGWAKYCVDDGSEWFITIKNVKNCCISTNNMQPINAPRNAEAIRTKVKEGDLLISITADLGRTGVVSKEIAEHGAYINQHLTCIRVDRKIINPLFIAYYLDSPAGKMQFEAKNQSAVKAGLNFEAINSLMIKVPPIELQNEFETFVEQVDKSKFVVQQALDKAQLLFDSLMQQYFG